MSDNTDRAASGPVFVVQWDDGSTVPDGCEIDPTYYQHGVERLTRRALSCSPTVTA
jgi:hypothetical protein